MKYLLITFFAIGILHLGCGMTADKGFMQQFKKGDPYTGTVRVNIKTPEGKRNNRSGNASLHFKDSTTNILWFVLFGAIDDKNSESGDAGFLLPGKYDDNAWQYKSNNMRLEINRNGKISGEFITDKEKYKYSGSISATSFVMKSDIELLKPTPAGLPAGTTLYVEHRLSRSDPDKKEQTKGSAKKCRKTVWQLRNVWNPGGGGMIMVRVPVCVD
jgi:hypothetical protein